jgi:hypothetical protein
MSIKSIHCHVCSASINLVTDFEGHISRVICPHYEAATAACRLKEDATSLGPLSQFLERLSEDTLPTRTVRCDCAV